MDWYHLHFFPHRYHYETHRCTKPLDGSGGKCDTCIILDLCRDERFLKCNGTYVMFKGRKVMVCPMQKPAIKTVGGPGRPGCDDKFLSKDCPLLCAFLVDDKYDDGTKRERSTLTLFIEDGKVKAALNDKNVGASLYRSGESILDAVEAIETCLRDGGGDEWRVWKKNRK